MIEDCDVASPLRVHLTAWPSTDLPALLDANDAVVYCTHVSGERSAVHAVVRQILGAFSRNADIAHTPNGKPYLADRTSALKFNLSHCGDVLVVGLSLTADVGVDIERVRPIPEWRRIADRVFDSATREQLSSEIAVGMDERDVFLRHWCRMEASVKATGEGVFGRHTRDTRVIDLPDLPLPAGADRYRSALALCP